MFGLLCDTLNNLWAVFLPPQSKLIRSAGGCGLFKHVVIFGVGGGSRQSPARAEWRAQCAASAARERALDLRARGEKESQAADRDACQSFGGRRLQKIEAEALLSDVVAAFDLPPGEVR